MIYGIGADIVENKRIENILKESDQKFLDRVFTAQEIVYAKSKKNPVPFFAVRFAAKEAFLKALGTGLRGNISLKDIEVIKDDLGKPEIVVNDVIK
ncbi:holo-ACP synthase, partial [bacterium]|nr:holo-ACP synthase [bacterium]